MDSTTNYCTYFGLWSMDLLETLGVLINRVIQINCRNTGLHLRVSGLIPNGSSGFLDKFSLSSICIADLGLFYKFHNAIGVDRRRKIKVNKERFRAPPSSSSSRWWLKLIIHAEVRSLVKTHQHCIVYLRASLKHEAILKTIVLM